MGISILAIGSAFGSRCVTNDDLVKVFPQWTPEKLYAKTKIASRPVCAEDETSLDLAETACRDALYLSGIALEKIDYLILCTQSPDYSLPPNSTILQHRLGLPHHIGCFDFSHGCSGYVYGLSLASAVINSGQANTVLLVTAESYSKYLSERDSVCRPIFGDGATATLLQASHDTKGPRSFVFLTDGSRSDLLIRPASGARAAAVQALGLHPEAVADGLRSLEHIYMNGAAIFSYTLEAVPFLLNSVLEKERRTIEQIDKFVFHQANGFILDHLRLKCKIPSEKFIVELESVGNTVSSSIPVALKAAMKDGRIQNNEDIFLVGFGVGLSSCACILTV